MRLHRLEVTAFGPFAGTVAVDFDELSAAGLFLLTGATGAGKTSVLDAVCFALYGQVPGDRASARHLRSDHAAPGLAPRVVLEASVGDRTFRFSRSPAWTRPKRRGTGETRVQAHAVVEELGDGHWVALTNRLDDAGLLVGDLLGMTATQFTQVAMLPQGRFQAFLRATSTERHAVLQKLFRTDRFEQVERWLVERRGATRRASEAAADRVRQVLHRLEEAAAAELPEGWADDLPGAADRGEVTAWAGALVATAEERLGEAARARAMAETALVATDAALLDARRIDDLQKASASAADHLVALDRRAAELTSLEERLTAHHRALPVAPLAARAAECQRAAVAADRRWREVELTVAPLLVDPPSRASLARLHEQAVEARTLAEAFRPRAAELATARARRTGLAERADTLAAGVAALDEAIAEHPDALAEARAELDESVQAATQLPVLEQEATRVGELVAASRRHDRVVVELESARADLAAAKEAALAAYETYLTVREARIEGMAAELAGSLAVGCACPVCGSASHPDPAHPGGRVVGRAEEDAARKVHEDAAFVQQGHEVRVATLATERASLDQRLDGVDRPALPQALTEARARLARGHALAGERDPRAARLESLEARVRAAREARDRALLDRATTAQQLEAADTAVVSISAELDRLLGDEAPDLEALLRHRSARCTLLAQALDAWSGHDEAARAATDAEREAAEAARDAGFGDVRAARAALLPPAEVEDAQATLTDVQATRRAAEQTLADPATRAAASAAPVDLAVFVARQRLAAETAQSVASAHDAATTRAQRLSALHHELGDRLAAWTPLRQQHQLVAGLSQLVEGKGADNPLRIRLAAYVLSERLRQVVAAANERLARMTAERYSLEHTDDRGAGEQRGGLSLRVRDDWNGVTRDPATLSGGETFVVSLALALGLADTVAHEAGGTDIDTLFIDEGFGSLDTDTLEDVMDTLDSLRDGGRVVGLISHVPELRSRITTQLEVLKGRNGSTLRPVLSVG